MPPGPHDIARRLQHHHPGWSIWYGTHTWQYWALATWVRAPHSLLAAATPQALQAAIDTFETLHPKPGQRHHAVGY